MAAHAGCFYCSLPITKNAVTLRVGEADVTFCCRGCSLVYQLLGRGGASGQSALLLARLAAGFVFGMVVMVITWSDYLNALFAGPEAAAVQPDLFLHRIYLPLAATAVMAILGLPIARAALLGLRQLAVTIDVLITIGIFAAYGLSIVATVRGTGHVYYDTATMILLLVTLGRTLESRSKASAAQRLRSLFDLNPREASVLRQVARGGGVEEVEQRVPAESLMVGDRVRVRPGETFAVDGVVVDGSGGVDQSALSGEALPVFKGPGSHVESGTTAIDGAFLVVAERVGDQTTVAHLGRLLEQAKESKMPILRLADRIAGLLVPGVLAIALGAGAYWTAVGGFERGLMVALAVLLIACPCALGLAAPLATWLGLAAAASRGVIVRSAEVLENAAGLRHVFFDKTGTLTTGDYSVACFAVEPSCTTRETRLVGIAGALEALSQHAIARAISRFAGERAVEPLEIAEFRAQAGLGVSGLAAGRRVHLGSQRYLEQSGIVIGDHLARVADERGQRGEMVVFLALERVCLALFSVQGALREEAPEAIAALRRLGVGSGVLTGDGRAGAEGLRRRLPIQDIRWGLLPEDKLAALREMRVRHKVAMVGDGVNDAPALAAADVGIALSSGTDLAREAADVTIFGGDLARVAWTIDLARAVRRTIAGNLFWACLYNGIGLSLAVAGVLTPVMSAAAMILSSACVIANSARLNRWMAIGPRRDDEGEVEEAAVADGLVQPC